jgi:hypothetical protein
VSTWLEKAPNLTPASKYTVFNGLCYLSLGGLLIVWPGVLQTLLREPAFVGREEGLVRVIGLMILLLGYYLLTGGRAGCRQITAASVLDRWTLVPIVLIPLVYAGVFPHFLIFILVVPFLLATSTWFFIRSDAAQQSAGSARHPS